MPRQNVKPDLASQSCLSLTLNVTFRLGRRALADCTGVTTRELLSKGIDLFESYDGGDYPHVVKASITLGEKFEGGAAESWNLNVQVYPLYDKSERHTYAGRKRFFTVLRQIGKTALEVTAGATARFFYVGPSPLKPDLPIPGSFFGGSFSHVIAYTLGRLSDDNEVLYEATIRPQDGNSFTIIVEFSYRLTLDEHLLVRLSETARSLAGNILAAPVDGEPDVEKVLEKVPPEEPEVESV